MTLSISKKLPLVVTLLAVLSASAVGILGERKLENSIEAQTIERFQVLSTERKNALETWFDMNIANVNSNATGPTTQQAISGFSATYGLLMEDPKAELQAAYITDNPNPIGEKDKLDKADVPKPYHFQHGTFHPFFRDIKDKDGLYDVFLFDLNGEMIYSVYKEADYATNFISGEFAGSGLGQAYRQAMELPEGEIAFADFQPYAPSADAPAAFIAQPVFDANGARLGVFAIQIPANTITKIIAKELGLDKTGDVYLVGADGLARSYSRFEDQFTILDPMPAAIAALAAEEASGQRVVHDLNMPSGAPALTVVEHLEVLGQPVAMFAQIALEEVRAPVALARTQMILTTLAVVVLAAVLGWVTSRNITRPLADLGGAMNRLTEKDYQTEVTGLRRGDEIGHLAKGLEQLRAALGIAAQAEEERAEHQQQTQHVVETLSVSLGQLAQGDFTSRIDGPFHADYDALRHDLNNTVDTLSDSIGATKKITTALHDRGVKMTETAADLSQRTESQAATLEETAAALEEITASVKSAADNTKEVEEVVKQTREVVTASDPIVKSAIDSMARIQSSSEQISQIIGVIDDIAFQTNLLALNAGVEAARAGTAGSGFAVVASEVRSLAQRATSAANEIKGLITESAEHVDMGVTQVSKAGDALVSIVPQIERVSHLVTDIATSAGEQAQGIEEINISVANLDQVTQRNAHIVEMTTTYSKELGEDADRLSQVISRFTLPNDVMGHAQIAAAQDPDPVPEKMPEQMPAQTPAPDLEPAPQEAKRAPAAPAFPTRAKAVGAGDEGIWQDF